MLLPCSLRSLMHVIIVFELIFLKCTIVISYGLVSWTDVLQMKTFERLC